MFSKWILFAALAFVVVLTHAADEIVEDDEPDAVDRNTVTTSHSRLNVGDITLPNGLVTLLANGGAVAAGILAVAAIAMLLMPAFGLRMCSIFGNCDNPTYQAYSAAPNSVYADYPGYAQSGTYNNPVYQKRSLEYIGPILKALGNAYEKYSKPAIIKKA
ncbi:uncharacterized protein LOC106666835 [Cimex lectularius]|uniref:Uncharacterized protein n=1 Tax=Cimex lectularius TaxID=79782 RepID=A0A8I6RTD2_CIMLE|nr:uncharacterized protein LOC106666835 [Cimex lectularius]